MSKISILVAAYKSEGLLRKVLCRSYFQHCLDNPDIEMVIYDNGGNGKELDVLREDPEHIGDDAPEILGITVIGDGKNIGLNAALNECAKVATGDYFYLPHTDMYLMPNWYKPLLEAAKNQPPLSYLLCSRSIEPTKGHTEYHVIKDYGKEWNEFREGDLLKDYAGYRDTTILTGYRMPFFLHRKLWEKMGGADSKLFSYCTDDDLVQTAWHVGTRKFWMVNASLVYHLQGKSNSQQTVDKDRNEPYEYFVKKWRDKGYADAQHPAHWHPRLIPWYIKIK